MSGRDALIETTKRLLSETGYQATSPKDIQLVSGVGQGSFYHHFGSKADLASAALSELGEEMRMEFDALEEHGELARAYLTADRDAVAGCRLGRLAMETALADDRLHRPVTEYFDHLRSRLTEHFREAGSSVDPTQLADLAVAAVQGGYVLARVTGDPDAQRSALAALLTLLAPSAESASEEET